jgi:hypothetical protein
MNLLTALHCIDVNVHDTSSIFAFDSSLLLLIFCGTVHCVFFPTEEMDLFD